MLLNHDHLSTASRCYQEHFRSAHGIRLGYPKMFGIITGSTERKVVYPFEVCTVEGGQFYKKKIPPEYTPKVVEFATKSPGVRLQAIKNGVGNPSDPLSLKAPVSRPHNIFEFESLIIDIGSRLSDIAIYPDFQDVSLNITLRD